MKVLQEEIMATVATTDGTIPWSSPVYFVSDTDLNFYWKSSARSRHSLQIAEVGSAAISLFSQTMNGTGLQAVGRVEMVGDKEELDWLEAELLTKRSCAADENVTNREQKREDGRSWYCLIPTEAYLLCEPLLGYDREQLI